MNEEYWYQIMERLLPDVTIFPWYTDDHITKTLPIPIDWNKYPQHFKFTDAEEIIPFLEILLKRPFDETVYIYAPYDFFSVIKAPLSTVVKNYDIFQNSGYMWLWNPVEGYVIQDDGFFNCMVGLIGPNEDPQPNFELKKDFFLHNDFSLCYPFRHLISRFGLTILNDSKNIDKANEVLDSFQRICPITASGTIDWDRIKNRQDIGKKLEQIIPTLEKLIGNSIENNTVYIEWYDEHVPIVETTLEKVIARYHLIIPASHSTIIFDLSANYVIEITPSGNITVGMTEKEPNSSYSKYLPKKNTAEPTFLYQDTQFYTVLKSFGIEIIMDNDANTILANFQKQIPLTRWGNVDWDKFDKKTVIGKDPQNVLPALHKLFNKKTFNPEAYVEWKESRVPLIKICLSNQIIDYRQIWVNVYGAFLFNLDEGYVIEVDVLKNITVGVL